MDYPPFDLARLFKTVFKPQGGEKVAVLIDLKDPREVVGFKFLERDLPIQRKAHDIFYLGLKKLLGPFLGACDFFAYEMTGGSNLELPKLAISSEGKEVPFEELY